MAALPNIVVILTDDEAALDGRLHDFTPHIRGLREQGVSFANFSTHVPNCCPSRASFFTGQYVRNHGVRSNAEGNRLNASMTIATQLQAAGYHTGLVGKYLNNWTVGTVIPGWDEFLAFREQAYYEYDLCRNADAICTHYGSAAEDYSTDVIAREAVAMIKRAPADAPLFLWVAPIAPHHPRIAAPRHSSVACAPSLWKPPNYDSVVDDGSAQTPTPLYLLARRERAAAPDGDKLGAVCGSLLAVDDLLRDVQLALADTGRLDDTLLIYTSDNGLEHGAHRLAAKQTPYESTKVPFYVSWPDRLGTAPRVEDELVQNTDLAPTLCELAGCTLGPYPSGQAAPDGTSFANILVGTAGSLARTEIYEASGKASGRDPWEWHALRTTAQSPLGRWHYVEYANGERELYDVFGGPCWAWTVGALGDPCELRNLVYDPAYAHVRDALAARLADAAYRGTFTPLDTTAPAAPTGLTAIGGIGAVALDWNDGPDETDLLWYAVYRRNPDGSWPALPVGRRQGSALTDGGLADGQTYAYRVTAVDTSRNESSAAEISAVAGLGGGASYRPDGYTLLSGSIYNLLGDLWRLYDNDDQRLEVRAAIDGVLAVADVQIRATVLEPAASIAKLIVAFDGNVGGNGTALRVLVENKETGVWELIAGPTVSADDWSATWETTDPAAYLSAEGRIDVRVAASRVVGAPLVRVDLLRVVAEPS